MPLNNRNGGCAASRACAVRAYRAAQRGCGRPRLV